MRVAYKQLCARCKKCMVLVTTGTRFPVCYECQKPELQGKITDLKMKKMFAIPEDLYKESGFLRSIKSNYLRFGNLTEKQLNAFKKVVEEMKKRKTETKA